MRKVAVGVLSLVLWLGLTHGIPAQEDARTIIARAVAAEGGEDKLAREVAVFTRIKGTIQSPVDGLQFTGEMMSQAADKARFTLNVEFGGQKLALIQALNGTKGWRSFNGQLEDLTDDSLAEMQRSAHVDRVINLLPLLKDNTFTLTPLGESKVGEVAVLGVKVAAKGQPDVSLYFDKSSGLLVKYAYRDRDPNTRNEVLQETLLSDYRVPNLAAEDEKLLRSAHLPVEGRALVDLLRQRMPAAVSQERVKELIRRLGDDDFEVREKAAAELVTLGSAVVPLLKEALPSADAEVSRRARDCLQQIGEGGNESTTAAVIRLLALRRPEGATEVLLDFAGRCGDEELTREAISALVELAGRSGKPERVLVQALEDREPKRRAAAAAALGRDDGAFARQPGRRLFVDGVKMPMKAVTLTDGKKLMERETVEVQFFNRFEESVFARPRDKDP